MTTHQGISLHELGAGWPQGGKRWFKYHCTASGQANWINIAEAVGGSVMLLNAIARSNGPQQTLVENSVEMWVDEMSTFVFGGTYKSWDAAGYQMENSPPAHEYNTWKTSDLVPEAGHVSIRLSGLSPDPVDMTFYLGYEPLTYQARLV
jgi:hypothetical protein